MNSVDWFCIVLFYIGLNFYSWKEMTEKWTGWVPEIIARLIVPVTLPIFLGFFLTDCWVRVDSLFFQREGD